MYKQYNGLCALDHKFVDFFKSLNDIDHKKPEGPDNIDPFLIKEAANVIAEPVILIFQSLSNTI